MNERMSAWINQSISQSIGQWTNERNVAGPRPTRARPMYHIFMPAHALQRLRKLSCGLKVTIVPQQIQNQRSHIQRYEKEADSLTTCTAAWHYQGHVVKDPRSNDYWQPLSFRSHPWSSQWLLPDAICCSGATKSWLVWRWSTGCLPVCCRCQDTLRVHSMEWLYHGYRPTASWCISKQAMWILSTRLAVIWVAAGRRRSTVVQQDK